MGKITKEACDGLINKLGLPTSDKYCQDWEITVACSDIAERVLDFYIYRKDLSKDEQFTLMYIIIESVNDYISKHEEEFPKMDILKNILQKEYLSYKEIIIEYSCLGVKIEDSFLITPFMREIIKA